MDGPQYSLSNSSIQDLKIITPKIFYDYRGENFESFDSSFFKKELNLEFNIDSFSISRKKVLRGLHGDISNYKLVQCLIGDIYLVVIDLRENSTTYKQIKNFHLSDKNKTQVLIQPGCVNGHLCMSQQCLFSYKLTSGYVPINKQLHVKWNDPEYRIFWPISNPILSERDY